jgi:peptide/nickel transport system permease protein
LKSFWSRFSKSRGAKLGAAWLLLLVLGVLIGPYLAPPPNQVSLDDTLLLPVPGHWLGTDNVGRDLLARALAGARVSLSVAVVAIFLSTLIGTVIGITAGYSGGLVDAILMRFTDGVIAFPLLFVVVAIASLARPSATNTIMIIGLTFWTVMARVVRAETLSLRKRDFVTAAEASGSTGFHTAVKQILPNLVGVIMVTATLDIPAAILTEAFLSFVGLGVSPPTATWGVMLSEAQNRASIHPWTAILPGLLIIITVLSFNFVGDGLKSVLYRRSVEL